MKKKQQRHVNQTRQRRQKKKGKLVKKQYLLIEFFQEQIDLLIKKDSCFTAANYRNAQQSVSRFIGKKADSFTTDDITAEWVSKYVEDLQVSQKLTPGSVDCYLRTFRAVYNHAVKQEHVETTEENPFKHIKIIVPVTKKRSLSIDEVRRLIKINLVEQGDLEMIRDLFLFLLFSRGMCFIDAFNLKHSDISGGHITYRRSKTKVPLQIEITPEIQKLIDRFREEGCPYLFPFLHQHQHKEGTEITEQSALRRVNRNLEKLGEMLGLSIKLTTYVARHTWATQAQASGISTAVISQGLGHCSERVTRVYMKGLPSQVLDDANSLLLERFFDSQPKKKKGKKKRCPIPCKNETSFIYI